MAVELETENITPENSPFRWNTILSNFKNKNHVFKTIKQSSYIIKWWGFFGLKLKISEDTGFNLLYFLGNLYRCFMVVLGYFSDLPRPTVNARGEATSIIYNCSE